MSPRRASAALNPLQHGSVKSSSPAAGSLAAQAGRPYSITTVSQTQVLPKRPKGTLPDRGSLAPPVGSAEPPLALAVPTLRAGVSRLPYYGARALLLCAVGRSGRGLGRFSESSAHRHRAPSGRLSCHCPGPLGGPPRAALRRIPAVPPPRRLTPDEVEPLLRHNRSGSATTGGGHGPPASGPHIATYALSRTCPAIAGLQVAPTARPRALWTSGSAER